VTLVVVDTKGRLTYRLVLPGLIAAVHLLPPSKGFVASVPWTRRMGLTSKFGPECLRRQGACLRRCRAIPEFAGTAAARTQRGRRGRFPVVASGAEAFQKLLAQ
jgi:hypothetical protein